MGESLMTAPTQGWSYRPTITRISSLLTFALAISALVFGWQSRALYYLSPAEGVGYALGILGGSLMLLLALYPVRKSARWMRHLGAVRHWFRMHMVFGIAGPIAILYHCNFSFGATNSNVALLSMLIVASSGLFGRYLYSRIHHGLYGGAIRVSDLQRQWRTQAAEMSAVEALIEPAVRRLHTFEAPLLTPRQTLAGAVAYALTGAWRRTAIIRIARRALRHCHELAETQRSDVLDRLQQRLKAASMVHRFNAFERFFGLWHVLHLPLFVLLIITGCVHVVAVHLY